MKKLKRKVKPYLLAKLQLLGGMNSSNAILLLLRHLDHCIQHILQVHWFIIILSVVCFSCWQFIFRRLLRIRKPFGWLCCSRCRHSFVLQNFFLKFNFFFLIFHTFFMLIPLTNFGPILSKSFSFRANPLSSVESVSEIIRVFLV